MVSAAALEYKIIIKGSSVFSEVKYDPVSQTVEVSQAGTKSVNGELAKIIYLKSRALDIANPPTNYYEMCSFDENKVLNLMSKSTQSYLSFTKNRFNRTYPKGDRVNSSNYSPIPGWACGAQMVALNWQTSTYPMWLNLGFFSQNGKCGYVIKSPKLHDIGYNPNEKFSPIPSESNITSMKLKILGAKNLPEPTENKFVNLDFDKEKKRKNGKNLAKLRLLQIFMELTVQKAKKLLSLRIQEAVFGNVNILMHVMNLNVFFQIYLFWLFKLQKAKKSKIMGVFSAPINCLKEGYRVFPIVDGDMIPVPNSKILVHISFDKRK